MINNKKIWLKSLQALEFILLFLMVNQLLRSMLTITDTGRIDGFQIFVSIILFIYFLFRNKLIQIIGGTISLLIVQYYLYYTSNIRIFEWLKQFFYDLTLNIKLIVFGKWQEITNEFRTFIFLIVLWIVIYLFVKIIEKFKSVWIIILFVTYFSIIDSIFLYDTKSSIISVIAFGLFLIAIERQTQIVSEEKEIKSISIRFIAFALILSLFITMIGYISPKADAKWVDPTGRFSSFQGKGIIGQSSIKKIGYGDDDSSLGGPFIQDDTIVINTISNKRVYLRGESKDQYTGLGWIKSELTNEEELVTIDKVTDHDFPYQFIRNSAKLERQPFNQRLIFIDETFNNIFLGGDWKKITVNNSPDINTAKTNTFSQNLFAETKIDDYTIEGEVPVISENLLRKTNTDYSDELIEEYLKPYMSLPETVPSRVSDLALEITSRYNNPYDKVNAIKYYLRRNYEYDTKNVPIPNENEDFVDQFLFESQIGYCDYFSTSMVVLSRSIGIPARWVKGFTPGEVTYSMETELYEGVIRNQDAHSWVEVYFSGVGWIPFEPTPNFRVPLDLKIEDADIATVLNNEDTEKLNSDDKLDKEDEPTNIEITQPQTESKPIIGWFFAFIFFIAVMAVYRFRVDMILLWLKISSVRGNSLKITIILITNKMMSQVGRSYKQRESAQTIREYFSDASQEFTSEEWNEATEIFELARYSNHSISEEWRSKIWEIWKKLINKIHA